MNAELIFLLIDEVLELHDELLAQFGGASGVRDIGLLESALAQPQATFGGEFLYPDISSIAACYLFGIAKNHAFIDGNKRTAAAAAIIFLKLNGWQFRQQKDEELAEITEQIAASHATMEELATFFRARIVDT